MSFTIPTGTLRESLPAVEMELQRLGLRVHLPIDTGAEMLSYSINNALLNSGLSIQIDDVYALDDENLETVMNNLFVALS